MRTLLIDDKKQPSELGYEVDKIARTYDAGIAALSEGRWDVLLLDHDLADFTGPNGEERKGWHIVLWLARPENRSFIPGKIVCVSYNPKGSQEIEAAIADLLRDPDQLVIRDPEYMQAYYASLKGDE